MTLMELFLKFNFTEKEVKEALRYKHANPELTDNQVIQEYRPDLIENIFGELIQARF